MDPKKYLTYRPVPIIQIPEYLKYSSEPKIHIQNINLWIHSNLQFPFKDNARFYSDGYGLRGEFTVKNLARGMHLPEHNNGMFIVHATSPLYIEEDRVTEKELIRAAFSMMLGFVIHECMEGFKHNNLTVFDPHDAPGDQIQMELSKVIDQASRAYSGAINPQSFPRERK
jgi:hypothetical protein